jgi:hypothetical protein
MGAGHLALGTDRTTTGTPRTTSHTPTHSTTSGHSTASAERQRERRERAWRDWYNRYHRAWRPAYVYPGGYPPGYTGDSTPTSSSPSGGSENGVVGTAPEAAGKNAPANNNNANPQPPANDTNPSTPQTVDPEVTAAVARVKKACLARADYQTAVADKKTAEDKLATLRQDGLDIDPKIATPLATTALEAGQRMAAIELEETNKDAQAQGVKPAQPAAAPAN